MAPRMQRFVFCPSESWASPRCFARHLQVKRTHITDYTDLLYPVATARASAPLPVRIPPDASRSFVRLLAILLSDKVKLMESTDLYCCSTPATFFQQMSGEKKWHKDHKGPSGSFKVFFHLLQLLWMENTSLVSQRSSKEFTNGIVTCDTLHGVGNPWATAKASSRC